MKDANYFHICRECNKGFFGYIKQHTCFNCIAKWALNKFLKGDEEVTKGLQAN